MTPWIGKVSVHEKFGNVLEVYDLAGALRTYLEHDGTFIPGRIWHVFNDGYDVAIFLPFMDGPPSLLSVTSRG